MLLAVVAYEGLSLEECVAVDVWGWVCFIVQKFFGFCMFLTVNDTFIMLFLL